MKTNESMSKQVERDIRNAEKYAWYIAEEAVAECSLWWQAREDGADEATVNWYYGRYQGKASALGWILGYETEESYTDMHGAMHDYLTKRGKAAARRMMAQRAS